MVFTKCQPFCSSPSGNHAMMTSSNGNIFRVTAFEKVVWERAAILVTCVNMSSQLVSSSLLVCFKAWKNLYPIMYNISGKMIFLSSMKQFANDFHSWPCPSWKSLMKNLMGNQQNFHSLQVMHGTGIFAFMHWTSERQCYIVKSSLIGWAHAWKDSWWFCVCVSKATIHMQKHHNGQIKLTHSPLGYLTEILDKWFQATFNDWWLWHLSWSCHQMNVTGLN